MDAGGCPIDTTQDPCPNLEHEEDPSYIQDRLDAYKLQKFKAVLGLVLRVAEYDPTGRGAIVSHLIKSLYPLKGGRIKHKTRKNKKKKNITQKR